MKLCFSSNKGDRLPYLKQVRRVECTHGHRVRETGPAITTLSKGFKGTGGENGFHTTRETGLTISHASDPVRKNGGPPRINRNANAGVWAKTEGGSTENRVSGGERKKQEGQDEAVKSRNTKAQDLYRRQQGGSSQNGKG